MWLWFDTGVPLDGLDDVLVLNVGTNTNSPEVPRERWQRLERAWQVPLAIGPTFRLRFSGIIEPPPAAVWEARVMLEGRGEQRWLPVRPGKPPYLRYDLPFDEGERSLGCWLEARTRDGLVEGRGELAKLAGVQEVEVACRMRAVLRGRVLDERGAPLDDVLIDAVQLSGGVTEQLRTSTAEDGSYELGPREPGRMRLAFMPPASTTTRKLTLEVPRGITRAPDLVLERRSPAGDVRGQLWVSSKEVQVDGVLRLRALDGSGYEETRGFSVGGRREFSSAYVGGKVEKTFTKPTHTAGFRFERVPRGRFELFASTNKGYFCTPGSIEVSAPAEGLVFRIGNSVGLRSYFLELTDAESGGVPGKVFADVQIDGAGSVVSGKRLKDGEALIELADGVPFRWTVCSAGYRMEHGSQRDFVLRGDALVATRSLRRGFGARLELRERSEGADHFAAIVGGNHGEVLRKYSEMETKGWEWSGRPVSGAEILANGEPVASSDEHGIAELELSTEPARIEVRLAGWRVLDSWSFKDGKVLTYPTAEVWMIRE